MTNTDMVIRRAAVELATRLAETLEGLEVLEDDELDLEISQIIEVPLQNISGYLGLNRDPLTGLFGRSHLPRFFNEAVKHGDVAILYLDANNFRDVNNLYSHRIGDAVLRELGRRLEQKIRSTRGGDYVVRVGGDEFIVIWVNPGGKDHAHDASSRLWLDLCSEPYKVGSKLFRLRLSGGLIWVESATLADLEELIDKADFMMKHMKAKKVDDHLPQIEAYSESLWQAELQRVKRREALQQAVLNGELAVLFQPIVNLDDETVVGFEAFPDPGSFDPELSRRQMFELIVNIETENKTRAMTSRILEEVAAFLERSNDPMLYVSINVTIAQLLDQDFCQLPHELAKSHGLGLNQFKFELVEREKLNWGDREVEAINRNWTAGMQLVLDDYGQGYNVPATFVRYWWAFDVVKLDAKFARLLEKPRDEIDQLVRPPEKMRKFVGHLIGTIEALGRQAVAEGVETQWVADELRSLGVCCGQGFLWGDKLSPEEALAYATAHRRP